MPELDLQNKQIKPPLIFERRLPYQLLNALSSQQHGIELSDKKNNIQFKLV